MKNSTNGLQKSGMGYRQGNFFLRPFDAGTDGDWYHVECGEDYKTIGYVIMTEGYDLTGTDIYSLDVYDENNDGPESVTICLSDYE